MLGRLRRDSRVIRGQRENTKSSSNMFLKIWPASLYDAHVAEVDLLQHA